MIPSAPQRVSFQSQDMAQWKPASALALRAAAALLLAAVLASASSSSATPAAHVHGSDEEQQCLAFLRLHMPPPDRDTLSDAFLMSNVRLALAARAATPWAAAVPWDIFLNDVLPYSSLDEPRDNWRPLFHGLFTPLVSRARTATEAAQVLNEAIWGIWGIRFKGGQTPAIMSPTQTIAAGHASCTGLSIFLVDALRSVGIPARVAGEHSMDR